MAEIHKRLAEVMSEVEALKKDRKNEQQGFMFRSYEAFYNMLQPKLAEKKIFTLPSHESSIRETYPTKSGGSNHRTIVRVKYTLFTEDGSSIEGFGEGEGVDTFDKSTSKAFTMSHKSFISTLFMIPFDADPDGQTPEARAAAKVVSKNAEKKPAEAQREKELKEMERRVKKDTKTNPSDFVITSKDQSLNGKRLKDLDKIVIRELLDQTIRYFETKNKVPGRESQQFIDAASEYLLQLEQGSADAPHSLELPPKSVAAPESIPSQPEAPKASPGDLRVLIEAANRAGMNAHDLYSVIEKEYGESFNTLTQLTFSKIMNRLKSQGLNPNA